MLLGTDKARNVACIIWIESLEKLGLTYYDLCGYIQGLNIPAVLSPVHNRDSYTAEDVRRWLKRNESKVYDPDTGEIAPAWVDKVPKVGDKKKAHVHLMISSKGARNASYYSALFTEVGLDIPTTAWEKVEHPDSMKRYFAHLDQPDKAPYDAFDIIGFGGIDLSCLVVADSNSKIKVLVSLMDVVVDNGFKSYHTLVNWAFKSRDLDNIACVTGRASYWTGYFNSMRTAEMDKANAKKAEQERQKAMYKSLSNGNQG